MKKVCTTCHQFDEPIKLVQGSFLFEICLWLCFLVPGFLYSIWRMSSKKEACSACHGTQLVNASSPVGQRIINQNRKEIA